MHVPGTQHPSLGYRLLPKNEKGPGGSHRHHRSDVSELCGKDHAFLVDVPMALPLVEGQNDHAMAPTDYLKLLVKSDRRGRIWHDLQAGPLKPFTQFDKE